MSTKFDESMERYHDLFGQWFPTMCFPTDSMEETIKKIDLCISSGELAEKVFSIDYSKERFF